MVEIIGAIKNCMLGSRTQKPKQYIVNVEGYGKVKASSLIGRKAVWTTSSGKDITGKVAGVHGDKGALRVIFTKGLPGQAIGTSIKIK